MNKKTDRIDPAEMSEIELCVDSAQRTLEGFAQLVAISLEEQPRETLASLLADLMHWCDARQIDFKRGLEEARQIYRDELNDM